MPSVGTRKNNNMGNFTKDPMYAYASAFCEAQQNILRESQVDYGTEPVRALAFKGNVEQLKRFLADMGITDIDAEWVSGVYYIDSEGNKIYPYKEYRNPTPNPLSGVFPWILEPQRLGL